MNSSSSWSTPVRGTATVMAMVAAALVPTAMAVPTLTSTFRAARPGSPSVERFYGARRNRPAPCLPQTKAATCAAVSPKSHDEAVDGEPAAGTLGAVLYANTTRNLLLEQEWVELVQSIAARDQAALHELYERAHRPVFTLILRITCNRQTAEEVTL